MRHLIYVPLSPAPEQLQETLASASLTPRWKVAANSLILSRRQRLIHVLLHARFVLRLELL